MPKIFAEGGNFSIELDAGLAYCRVWARPDVDSATGARFAREKIAHFEALARGDARAIILDLTSAPPVTGPVTQESLGHMLAAWERAGRPIAVVVSDNPTQLLQLRRLVTTHAAHSGAVFSELSAARTWVRDFK
jgi:hypothetical protein